MKKRKKSLSYVHLFWPVLLVGRFNRQASKPADAQTRKPAWPIQWLLKRLFINRNEAEMLEWRPVIRPADVLAFIIEWNCAISQPQLHFFFCPDRWNFLRVLEFYTISFFFVFSLNSFGEAKVRITAAWKNIKSLSRWGADKVTNSGLNFDWLDSSASAQSGAKCGMLKPRNSVSAWWGTQGGIGALGWGIVVMYIHTRLWFKLALFLRLPYLLLEQYFPSLLDKISGSLLPKSRILAKWI